MFREFLLYMVSAPVAILKRVFKNPMGIFVYSLLSNWYITIYLAGVIVAFWVFKGLEKAGVLDKFNTTLNTAILDSKSIAQHCVPKINDLNALWECAKNPPEYIPSKEELLFEKIPQKEMNPYIEEQKNNPYDSKVSQ